MSHIEVGENYGLRRTRRGVEQAYRGELEFEIRNAQTHQVLDRVRDHNLVKIAAKEILAHRLPSDRVWDPRASGGAGDWITHGLNLTELAPRYICFGASFNTEGIPLDSSDERYYIRDESTGAYVARTLGVGAEFGGGLINAIPISEPVTPLKRVERIFYEPTYQPAGTPLLQSDVRALNNIVVLETTLRKEEYNGFGVSDSDFFTITEVALVAGKELGPVGVCNCDPRSLFLEGNGDSAIPCTAAGTATISLGSEVSAELVDLIREGDQVKVTAAGAGRDGAELGQVTPYYLVTRKAVGGRDITLDRTPVNSEDVALSGPVGVFRDGFRIFSHRILKTPIKKSVDFEIVCRWRIIFN